MNILVTGCAGFIGFHLSKLLLEKKYKVIGIDNLNDYYDVNLKKERLRLLKKNKYFTFKKIDICNLKNLKLLFKQNKIKIVINLAAQAGVRYSIVNPKTYLENNVLGYFNLLEVCRNHKINHLVQASTSSVYGNHKKFPLNEKLDTSFPLSFYAASKKSTEVLSHSYSYIYNLPITCLRFFTVYGPYGRPDMALFKFVKNIQNGRPIKLFNFGNHQRDFTYVEDVAISIEKIMKKPSKQKIPFEIYNIGSNNPVSLMKFVNFIETQLQKRAKFIKTTIQLGDIFKTHADNYKITKKINYSPQISIEQGVKKFINWFKQYY